MALMQGYQQRWARSIYCVTQTLAGTSEASAAHTHAYLVSDGRSSLSLLAYDQALPRALIELAITSGGTLNARQQQALRHSKGYLIITKVVGAPLASERATFAAQVMLSLLQHKESLGFVNVVAQHYWTKDHISLWHIHNHLASADLFSLLTSISLSDDNRRLVSHGMEQFALPDLEIAITNPQMLTFYQCVLVITAARCIDHNQALKDGLIFHPAADSLAYKVMRPPKAEQDRFGEYGAISLVQQ